MVIQSDVYTIIFLTIVLGSGIVVLSKKIDALDPMEKPKGILLPVLLGVQSVYNTVKDSVGKHYAEMSVHYLDFHLQHQI